MHVPKELDETTVRANEHNNNTSQLLANHMVPA